MIIQRIGMLCLSRPLSSIIIWKGLQTSSVSNGQIMKEWIQDLNLEDNQVPSFKLKGKNISILKEPADFYKCLQEGISKAEKRITIASLYLGTDRLEKKLVENMLERLERYQESLKVNILLDHTRGSRGDVNSRTMLLPLVEDYPDNAKVSFYHTPLLRGLIKSILPMKMNETLSVTHLKVYLFDDTLIMSGANLSDDYFTNRQDRYIVFKESSLLCDYFDDLVDTVSNFSLNLQANGSTVLSDSCLVHPETGSKEAFCEYASAQMQRFIEHHNSAHDYPELIDNDDCDEDTIVYPLLQMNHFNIHQDASVTSSLLENAPLNSQVSMATAYLNIPPNYWDCIINAKANIDIIFAHPKAMGFYGAAGILGKVPNVYILIAEDLYNSLKDNNQNERVTFYEFLRDQWTFHGKGLWATINNDSRPEFLTMIGSPNFGYRSTYKDLEAQLLMVTSNGVLIEKLENERLTFYQYCQKFTKHNFRTRTSPLWVKIFKAFFYRFF